MRGFGAARGTGRPGNRREGTDPRGYPVHPAADPRTTDPRGLPAQRGHTGQQAPVDPRGPGGYGEVRSTGGARSTDAPMVENIFPNWHRPTGANDPLPSADQIEALAGFGRSTQHRKASRIIRFLGRRNGAAGGLVSRPLRRRGVLLGLGTGVVVAGGAGGAAALLTGAIGPLGNKGGSGRPDTVLEGLGAAGLADSPGAAAAIAASATPTWPTPLGRDAELHLLRRATFGPTLLDVVAVRQIGIDAWLERQLNPPEVSDPTGDEVLAAFPTVSMSAEQIRANVKENDWLAMQELGQATFARQMWSTRQLFEVMVDFWANHLNVTNPFDGGWDVRTPYDNDVIRAHALGKFSDMLLASAQHPAMMRYLDNASSQKRSVNENYGRELLELHTLGREAGYTEVDVRNSAYILTGRTVDREGRFTYDARRHWTGEVKVLEFTDPNASAADGMRLGDAYVHWLAHHPATAKRVAHKLARRFVCDDPPQTLVDRLAQSYLDNGTATVPVLRTLFSSVEFWMSNGLKTRRPLENVVATARILGVAPGAKTADGLEGLYWMTNQLGHAPLNWSPPDGYPDVADAWGSAHATLGTWNAHRALVQGWHKGVTYAKPETFVGMMPATVGEYLETISLRLVHQPMQAGHKAALLTFLGAEEGTEVKNIKLGGKIEHVVPLVLDSVYHALR
jgi:uncharacterized protein (DUF1800 family)